MNLIYKGTTIEVTFSESGHYFDYLLNGVKTRVITNFPIIEDIAKQIILRSITQKLDSSNNPIPGTDVKNKYPYTDGGVTYSKWYNYVIAGKFGDAFYPSVNGVLSHNFNDENLYCFNPSDNWSFFQPVIFSLEATTDTITATVENDVINNIISISGTCNIRYSIDGETWQESNVFTGLQEGTSYQVEAKTLENEFISTYSISTETQS